MLMRALGTVLCMLVFNRLGAGEPGRFESLGVPVAVGGLMGCIVGPDGKGGEALYFNFNQTGGTLFLVQVNPDTGEARQFSSPRGAGAWAFISAPDKRIYLGTWEDGYILRFDPEKPGNGIQVVGKPAPSESYLWQYAAGPDGKLYACTYPSAKLVSYDPASDRMEDLGRMHAAEMYSRSVAVGPQGKVYVGIGTVKGDLIVFDPATRQHRSLLPPGLEGANGWSTVSVSLRGDGQVYAEFGTNRFKCEDEDLVRVASLPDPPPLKLKDGRIVTSFGRGSFALKHPETGAVVEKQFKYTARGDNIFVIGAGPSNWIYGSTVLPLEVFRHNTTSGKSEHLGPMPGGEVYSILEHQGKVYMCYYGGAVMNLYDPSKPFWKYGPESDCNPITFGGVGDGHLRPQAMIHGPDGMICVGSEPPYGQLGGAMGVWDPKRNRTVENYRHLITNQSIISLAWEPKSGLIFGGSGTMGGGGALSTEKEARFFAFDPRKKTKVFEAALVPGAQKYAATAALNGLVYAAASDKLVVFDPVSMTARQTIDLPGSQVETSLGPDDTGRLVGLTRRAVYILDPATGSLAHQAASSVPIRCGFAVLNDWVYFGSGPTLWRYHLPPPPSK